MVFRWICLVVATVVSVSARVSLPSSPNAFSPIKDTGCPAEFEGRCRCGPAPYGPDDEINYITNCTNAGFQEVHMLKSLPIETQVLIFTGNEVFNLPVNLFGTESKYAKLHTIDLSDNHIQGIRGRTFHTVSSVKTLILNDNDLYVVSKDHHPRMFSNFEELEELYLKNAFTDKQSGSLYLSNVADTFQESELLQLKKLDMSENGLEGFHDSKDIFCSLPELEELSLSDNRLTSLDDLSLSCLEHLHTLDISHNHFTALSNASLKALEHLQTVNLSSNPFQCDCSLHDTVSWLRRTTVYVPDKDTFRCEEGLLINHAGQQLTSLHEDELPCGAYLDTQFEGHLHVSYAVLAIVISALSVLLALVLYRNRTVVAGLFSTCTKPLRNKLHYSSLDKREEAEMEV